MDSINSQEVQVILEDALKSMDYDKTSVLFSRLCKMKQDIDILMTACHSVSTLIGQNNDENWVSCFPEKWEKTLDKDSYPWRMILKPFPEFSADIPESVKSSMRSIAEAPKHPWW
jgi:hypothetical protein